MLQMKRRTFLKLAAAATAGVAIAPRLASAKISYPANPQGFSVQKPDETKDVKIVRSMCFMCHGRCGTQIKVVGGEVVKIDGNPYDPNCYDYESPNSPVLESDLDAGPTGKDLGSLCVKGLAGVYTLYNPRRLQHPVKRVGKKGSRKWKRVSWDDAYNDIVNGGNLFGEGHVDGLKAIMSDEPIGSADSAYMDEAPPTGYGPKRNLFSWTRGRDQNRDLTRARFCTGFGTTNVTSHYTVCETTRNETLGNMGADGSPDFFGVDYLILAGSSIYDAEFPMQTKLRHYSKWFARRPGTKAVYLGPRQGKVCASGAEWVPIKTGTDNGFFMGMARYIIENKLYDAKHLSAPNDVVGAGQQTYTSMTYLVKKAEPRTYLTDADGNNLVVVGGAVVTAKSATTSAELEASTADADTLFKLIKERVMAHTFDEYNDFCEIPRGTIERIAKEFTSAEKSCVDCYKGPAQHSNGYYNIVAMGIVNILTNRLAQPGGLTGGGGYYGPEAPKGAAEPKLSGVLLGCSGSGNYAGSKASATRPWIPLGIGKNDGTWQEEYAGMSIGYPYQPKALMMYTANPVISNPRGAYYGTTALQRIPLVVAIDLFMNEASMQSDYVLPDTSYLENWAWYSATGATKSKRVAFRQPAVGDVVVGKEHRGIYPDVKTAAQIHIDIANKLGLPNFGKNADGKGNDVLTDTQFWNIYFNNKDFKGGLDPNASHIRMGGIFSTKRSDSSLPREKPSLVHGYVSKAATIKNAFNGKYFDPLPRMVWHLDANWDEWKYDKAKYNLLLGTHKDAHHTQSRTAENLWLMSMEPTNGLEINPSEAAKLGVKTGDWVEIENTVGEKYKVQVILTETMRPGYGEIKNSYGRWEHGSRDIEIEGGSSIKGDARVGAGFHCTWIWSPDPAIVAKGQDPKTIAPPTEPVFGSATQMGTPVNVRKV